MILSGVQVHALILNIVYILKITEINFIAMENKEPTAFEHKDKDLDAEEEKRVGSTMKSSSIFILI